LAYIVTFQTSGDSIVVEMPSNNPQYIYEMKYSKRRELNQILDVNEGWKKLGKFYRKYETVSSDGTCLTARWHSWIL